MENVITSNETLATIIIDLIEILLAIIAAFFAYYTFFREGKHKQRVEFDLEINDLGIHGTNRIIEIVAIVENKGLVEHTISELTLTARGIDKSDQLKNMDSHEYRLAFKHKLAMTQIVPEDDYFFIRPKVTQRFPMVIKIPISITHVIVRCNSIYKATKEFHITERAFAIPINTGDA